MTHLRKMILEELQGRNYAETPINSHLRSVEPFYLRFNCSPDGLGPRHIRNIKPSCFRNGSSRPTRWRNVLRLYDSSTPRLSSTDEVRVCRY